MKQIHEHHHYRYEHHHYREGKVIEIYPYRHHILHKIINDGRWYGGLTRPNQCGIYTNIARKNLL